MTIKLKHPTFPRISDEMKHHSALLAEEMRQWPEVRVGAMFGMTSIYRGETILALLPGKRGLELPNAIAIKQNRSGGKERHKWQSVLIESDADLGIALKQLEEAYRKATIASGKHR